MAAVVAIVCEYNPFHNGHEYHIKKIRDEFGPDTTVIAIMSGNYTQRGELAIMDKTLRAKIAVECGVNLVLELPFPFSISSAEFFARSAVKIIDSLKIVDYISFGSESGDTDLLVHTADSMLDGKYKDCFNQLQSDDGKSLGYPRLVELALSKAFPDQEFVKLTPNNILAIEYIKALKFFNSKVKIHTVKRVGADFDSEEIKAETVFQSASAIRSLVKQSDFSALDFMPKEAISTVYEAINKGLFPTDEEKLSSAVISNLRLNSSMQSVEIQDAQGGLYNRLKASSFEASTIKELVSLTETKKFTNARIRRVLWYTLFGVTSSEARRLPLYTQVLAMDSYGRAALKTIGKLSDFPILTKPSRTEKLSMEASLQKAKSDLADSVFQLSVPSAPSGNFPLKFTPYVKIDE